MSRKVQTPKADPNTIIGYVRVSTEDQAQHGVSLGAQRERLVAYATAHGLELIGIQADEGISGKVPAEKRPGLAAALACVRRGEAAGILVLKLDRLSRSTMDILKLVDTTQAEGWRLVSVSEHLDTSTAAGKMIVTVLAALSEMEREQISERTQMAVDSIARSGRARSGRIPFGYQNADGSDRQTKGDRRPIEKNIAEQAILGRILSLDGEGLGVRRIARRLNEAAEINPRTLKPWAPTTVAAILKTAARRAAVLAA